MCTGKHVLDQQYQNCWPPEGIELGPPYVRLALSHDRERADPICADRDTKVDWSGWTSKGTRDAVNQHVAGHPCAENGALGSEVMTVGGCWTNNTAEDSLYG